MTNYRLAIVSRLDGLRGRPLLRSVARRGLALGGLSALALTQPVLGSFGENPEFFVAGHYRTNQVVLFALVVAFVPPLLWTGVVAVASWIDRRAGTVAFAAGAVLFAFAFGLALLRSLQVDALVVVVLIAAAFAAGATYLLLRANAMRLFVSYLAAANLLFVALFLFASGTSDLVIGGDLAEEPVDADLPRVAAPVVMIVLDEFPVASLMDADGNVNADRYPGFAELAEVSTWYRNASSPSPDTQRAVPALLSGRHSDPDLPATYMDYPNNLFTMLGDELPVERYEAVTNMCPSDVCEEVPPQPLSQALSDAAVVYGHRVAPSSVRDGLPTIEEAWGGFAQDSDSDATNAITDGGDDSVSTDNHGRDPLLQMGILKQQIGQISEEPAIHYAHVLLPHSPWLVSESGFRSSSEPDWQSFTQEDSDEPGHEFRRQVFQQLQAMQTGAADAMISELLDRLQALPNWDDVTLVVTADHGTSLISSDLGREEVTDENRVEVHRVPLFIKAPDQVEGDVNDESVQTIDVMPSIVDLLDVEVSDEWSFDGHSLYDGSTATSEPVVSADVDEVLELAAEYNEPFQHGTDWLGLAAVGEHGELVGAHVETLDIGSPSDYDVSLDDADLFDSLPTDDGEMPFVLTGTVEGTGDEPPPELVVAINGRIAGVVGGYQPDGDGWELIGYVADLYQEGANDVQLYEVTGSGDEATLHPLD